MASIGFGELYDGAAATRLAYSSQLSAATMPDARLYGIGTNTILYAAHTGLEPNRDRFTPLRNTIGILDLQLGLSTTVDKYQFNSRASTVLDTMPRNTTFREPQTYSLEGCCGGKYRA